ncbi:MAG: Tex family protein [Massiliimalia sp.]|jgi:uncharacterized protein
MNLLKQLEQEFSLQPEQVENTVKLLDEGNTIPFIARYRKEVTGSLDDQTLRQLSERLEYLRNLEKRKQEISEAIIAQEKMTPELQKAIDNAQTLAQVEDCYRPYKQKRKTRASVARERGLEPLAQMIREQKKKEPLAVLAKEFIGEQVPTVEDAVQGAKDILAEDASDDAKLRDELRRFLERTAKLVTVATDSEKDSVYRMYYEYEEPVSRIAGHRVLAVNRGEREEFLKVTVQCDNEEAIQRIKRRYVTGTGELSQCLEQALEDSWQRLIFPSLERELRSNLTQNASEQAIGVFSQNLEKLLMQPPVKGAVTLGFDPGYRHGCKLAVVDPFGKVLDTAIVYPHFNGKDDGVKEQLKQLIARNGVQVIAIGNGTASRESEQLVAEVIHGMPGVAYVMVSEAGASVYSASELAAEEFPQYDVSLRSAISIARRLQDPLAELVKIDPKAIGVGQYQHDMPKTQMNRALDGVVEDCVNSVGVELNTASGPLLARVAGINSTVAKNIVAYREENGGFHSRKELKKVRKLGDKAFVQCAGFLRVGESEDILDHTGVHPESYEAAKKILKQCSYTLEDVKNGNLQELPERVKQLGAAYLAEQAGVGVPTLEDIVGELLKPGRDPRDELPKPMLRTDVLDIKDLKPGMELKGTVRNVIDFGAFVDIGVHEDGLVHISQICDRYIKHPMEVLSVGDIVTVWVLDADEKRGRISLTMKKPKGAHGSL